MMQHLAKNLQIFFFLNSDNDIVILKNFKVKWFLLKQRIALI